MKKIFLFLSLITIITFVGCQKDDNNTSTQSHESNIQVEMPRFLTAHGGKIYATCYNPCCVIRIDTATLKVEAMCKLGKYHPEGLCALGNKLYVTSGSISDESSNYSYDNKIYVVDIASFSIVDSILTGYNPERIAELDNNRIIVSYRGDYASNPEGTDIIDVHTKNATTLSIPLYKFDFYQGNIYGYTVAYDASWNVTNKFYRIDANSLEHTEILTNFTAADHAYGMNVNPNNGDLIIMTDGNYIGAGDAYIYHNDGTIRCNAKEMTTMPSKAVAIDNNTLMILCEGSWGYNDSDISIYNFTNNTVVNNAFALTNGRGLGDVGQDILLYGNKIYTTVTCSNTIEVIERSSEPRSMQILL